MAWRNLRLPRPTLTVMEGRILRLPGSTPFTFSAGRVMGRSLQRARRPFRRLPAHRDNYGGLRWTSGDFDGDGHQDVAVLWGAFEYGIYGHAMTETVIYYGKGDGSFSDGVVANVGANGFAAISAADLNQDGRDEIVLHGEGTLNGGTFVSVLHGKADRTFLATVNYDAGWGLASMNIADLNRDGFPDLIFSNGDYNGRANTVTVLMNIGNAPVVAGALRAAPEPSYVGQGFSLIASFTAPDGSPVTGNVDFLLDGNCGGLGSADG